MHPFIHVRGVGCGVGATSQICSWFYIGTWQMFSWIRCVGMTLDDVCCRVRAMLMDVAMDLFKICPFVSSSWRLRSHFFLSLQDSSLLSSSLEHAMCTVVSMPWFSSIHWCAFAIGVHLTCSLLMSFVWLEHELSKKSPDKTILTFEKCLKLETR